MLYTFTFIHVILPETILLTLHDAHHKQRAVHIYITAWSHVATSHTETRSPETACYTCPHYSLKPRCYEAYRTRNQMKNSSVYCLLHSCWYDLSCFTLSVPLKMLPYNHTLSPNLWKIWTVSVLLNNICLLHVFQYGLADSDETRQQLEAHLQNTSQASARYLTAVTPFSPAQPMLTSLQV